jgi:hypothetical protein
MVDDTLKTDTNVETHDIAPEDVNKAKKKAGFFGDPILSIE